ncbi:hypothetical protein ACQPZX_46325 [Actinoplanes sp. CA-142083]|uniref:hypothetical protein n=1 Tax=Actinoplanes sp. CA-142083 TaxID=3239903 RepID=UPI003D8B6121
MRRRPSLGTLLRLVAVAVLLAAAALASWSPRRSCTSGEGAAADPSQGSPTAAAPPSAGNRTPPAGTATTPTGNPPAPAANGMAPAVPAPIPSGSLGVPIRLADPTALGLVRPGARVDLLRLNDEGGPTAIAAAALVLRVTGAGDPTAGGLLLALTPAEAQRAVATPGHGFAILIRPD